MNRYFIGSKSMCNLRIVVPSKDVAVTTVLISRCNISSHCKSHSLEQTFIGSANFSECS